EATLEQGEEIAAVGAVNYKRRATVALAGGCEEGEKGGADKQMRNAKFGMRNGSGKSSRYTRPTLGFRIPHSAFRIRFIHSALRILSLAEREEIREEAIRTGDTSGELSEEAQPGIHVRALAHRGHEQSALERWLAGIVHLDERRVGRIPIMREIQSPLLHPAPPVVGPDVVGDVEPGAREVQNPPRRGLVGQAVV